MKNPSLISRHSNLFKLIFFPSIFLLFSCSASRELRNETDASFEELPAFDTGFAGFILYDPEKKEVIYQHNADKYFTPASNTKLFTFYTGLQTLGDSVPALRYTVRNDSLFFWGTGDPSFMHKEYPESKVLDFLKESEEQLVYVPPMQPIEHFGPGWSWDDYNWYYSVERGAMPIYGNYVHFTFKPGKSVPEIVPEYFENSVQRDSTLSGTSSKARRNRLTNDFVFQQKPENEKEQQVVPFIYSPELLVKLLSDTLNKPVALMGKIPAALKPDHTLYSIPSDSLYKRMLQISDNFIAEQILLMSSQKISDTLNTEIAIDYMMENHLNDLPDEPIWVDGSGLSNYNKFTPRSIVALLKKIREEVPQERLFELLPAGGVSGTIKNLYKAEQPYIFAKTGTLSNAHMLSGFLRTKEGKILIFSFMNNNYTVPSSVIKNGMEKILRNIYLNYKG